MKVEITGVKGRNYYPLIDDLCGKIIPEESSVKVISPSDVIVQNVVAWLLCKYIHSYCVTDLLHRPSMG